MKDIKIVIGANFGDEGKGLMTDYFAQQAKKQDKKCIVVCHNGSAQRGHTVTYPSGLSHVFRHFGSGTFTGAHTYLTEEFVVNPIIFRKEYEELHKLGYTPVCFIHPFCKVATPFDMLANQILESSRGDLKHGSCGLGLHETLTRHKSIGTEGSYEGLNDIKLYYQQKRLPELKITQIDSVYENVFNNPNLVDHFLEDYEFMMAHSQIAETEHICEYDTIIFEGGQGLLLDQNNEEYFPHLTPSNTGLKNPASIILETYLSHKACRVEECYVTRSYMTRHGAGKLKDECNKEDINSSIHDATNITNEHQGSLRYGKLDMSELADRVRLESAKNLLFSNLFVPDITIAITHLNETDGKIIGGSQPINFQPFDRFYKSYSQFGGEVFA